MFTRVLRCIGIGWCLALLLVGGVVPAASQGEGDGAAGDAIIRALIDAFTARNGAAAYALFDPSVQAMVTPDILAPTWDQLEAAFGTYVGIAAITPIDAVTYTVELTFNSPAAGRTPVIFMAVLSPTGGVLGFVLSPESAPAITPADVPAYADLSRFTERELSIAPADQADQPVGGTLSLPTSAAAPVPVVIILSGSGPSDRDGTVGAQLTYRDLAVGLASQGIAVLRYDDRTLVYPQSFAGAITVEDEYLPDLRAAVDLLTATVPEIDPTQVYLLGHSLGGIVAPRMAAALPEGAIAGIIFAAGTTITPLHELAAVQSAYLAGLDGEVSEFERVALESYQADIDRINAAISDDAADLTEVMFGAPLSYWRDLAENSPTLAYSTAGLPGLIIHGQRDYQVTNDELAGWLEAVGAAPAVTTAVFPCVIHTLVAVPDCPPGLGTPDEYALPLNVAPAIIDTIAAWISDRDFATRPPHTGVLSRR